MKFSFMILISFVMILCVLLIFIILSQNPKNAGLSEFFNNGGGEKFNIENANNFIDKITWILFIIIIISILLLSIIMANPLTNYISE